MRGLVDNDFTVDLDDILATLSSADVVVMRFVSLGQRLLLDFRTDRKSGPVVRVVRPVNSVEERYRELRKIRPGFENPERIVSIWWPRFAGSLRASLAWQAVLDRVSDSGFEDSLCEAEAAIDELVAFERQAARDAVSGNGYRTLWSASAARR
jgi:hypothetical protein